MGVQEKDAGYPIIGMGADEVLQDFAVSMRMRAARKDRDDTIVIHPTAAGELVTLRWPVPVRRYRGVSVLGVEATVK